jgi:hypothetical protein
MDNEEDDIETRYYNCNNHNKNNDIDYQSKKLETENNKFEKETQELLEKTKIFMLNYNNSNANTSFNTISHRSSTSMNNSTISSTHRTNKFDTINYAEEKPIDSSKIIKTEKDEFVKCGFKNGLTNSNLSSNNLMNVNVNVNSLNQRLLEKIRIIKQMEKQLKDKEILVERLNTKIDKQKEEITNLNEKLKLEKASTLRMEINALNRKLKEKDEENNKKAMMFDNIINEYKNKIEELIATNENTLNRMKEIELKHFNVFESKKILQSEFDESKNITKNFEKQLNNLKENFESELKEKKKLEDSIKYHKKIINLLIEKTTKIYEGSKKMKNIENNFINKLNSFFEKDTETENLLNSSQSTIFNNNDINKEMI